MSNVITVNVFKGKNTQLRVKFLLSTCFRVEPQQKAVREEMAT